MRKIAKRKRTQNVQLQSYIMKLIKASTPPGSNMKTSANAVEVLNTSANYLLERILKAAEDIRTGVVKSKTIDLKLIKACIPLVVSMEVLTEASSEAERAIVRMMT